MCKSERFLTVLREHIIFNVKWVDIRKTSEVFWSKLYCKMSDIFRYFLLALRLSTWKSENLKKSLMTSTGTCGRIKKQSIPEIIFSKREFQIWDFESFIFWSEFRFWGLFYGVLASVCFFNFSSSANHGGQLF